MADAAVLEGCDSFTLGSGRVGVLLIHGYTGSPQGLRELGEHLADRGMSVSCPRLPGHGTSWQDLNNYGDQDWTDEVRSAFEELSGRTDQVFLVCLSFGAALGLDLAARYPERVAGIVTMAGMVFTKDPRRHLAPLIAKVVKSIPGVGNDIADPDGKEVAYDRIPPKATIQMLNVCKRAKGSLSQVRAPILVIHGRQDHTVHPDNAQYIYDNVGSTDKDLLWLERSYHVVTLDYEKDLVAERITRFIEERSADGE